MQFIDLGAQQHLIREKIEANIKAVLDHNRYIMGPEVDRLEDSLAEFTGSGHAIACSSGTDALALALMTHDVGPGDAIFTSPFTFIATAEVVCLFGATPVFVDIDPHTFNMDPDKLEQTIMALKARNSDLYPLPLAPAVGSLTPKGIIGVDLFGLPADYDRINAVGQENGLFVIEDAAQSFGGEYKGKKACSLSDVSCTSFFPAKPLGCYGDGGMCFTDDDSKAEIIRSFRIHGQAGHKYENVRVGINGRLDTIQAAILLAKFDIFPAEIESREQVAHRYGELISNSSLELVIPRIPNGYRSAWAQYSVLARNDEIRSSLQDRLGDAGIPSAIYYPKPLHLQMAFSSLGYKEGDFPVSEDCSQRIFSLPMHPYLTEEEQGRIVHAMETVF